MQENRPLTPEELAHQMSAYAHSLRAAGVEFLPAKSPNTIAARPEPAASPGGLLFDLVEPAPTTPAVPLAQRQQELQVLCERVAACQRCPELVSTRRQTVFGVGSLDPDVCFIGEAPGEDEDRQGEPFVGAAGQLLNRIIAACGMKREEVYICNILRCRPPRNRTPTVEEATNCREYLERTLELVHPKYICCLGACAAQNLLQTTLPIGRLRGRFHNYKDTPVICTYHPAFLLPHRSPERKKDVWEDMKMLLAKMGRPIPGKS